ncbi:hypothetical protein EV122DRAFT_283689 [Schizophyllum commune]
MAPPLWIQPMRWPRLENATNLSIRHHINDCLDQAQLAYDVLHSKHDADAKTEQQLLLRYDDEREEFFRAMLGHRLQPPPPNVAEDLASLRKELAELRDLVVSIKATPPPAPPAPPQPSMPSWAETVAKAPPARIPSRPPAPPKPSRTPAQPKRKEPTPTPPTPPHKQDSERPCLALILEHPTPVDAARAAAPAIVRKIGAALQASPLHSQVRVSAAKPSHAGNLVIVAGPETTAKELVAASDTIVAALKPEYPICRTELVDVWEQVVLDHVPTGVANDRPGAFTEAECNTTLAANNALYRQLELKMPPRWVRDPSSYTPGSFSSLTFAFRDPDGTMLRQVLASGTFFAFGAVAKVRRWKPKPRTPKTPTAPKSTPSSQPPAPITPAQPPSHDPARDVDSMEVEPTTRASTASNTPGLAGVITRSGTTRRPPDSSPPAPEPKRRRRGGDRSDANSG